MKIDIYAHICPKRYIDAVDQLGIPWQKIVGNAPKTAGAYLWDINARLEVINRYEDYVQVLVPSGQVLECCFNPENAVYLARIFNDSTAEIISKYPHKFVAAVAALPLNDIDAALKEIDRTVNELGFKGILLHTPVFSYDESRAVEDRFNYDTMRPLDSPEFMPIFEKMAQYNLPIWIHPVGQGGVPSYKGEKRTKYMLFHIFGWPIESAMAMGRLVFSGVLAKYPNLRFIMHHCGSGIVPALAGRIEDECDKFALTGALKFEKPEDNPFRTKKPLDYYRMFYADTAICDGVAGLMCGYDLFGAEHMVFGTDYPYDAVGGVKLIDKGIDAIHRMDIPDLSKKMVFEDNARRILHLNNR